MRIVTLISLLVVVAGLRAEAATEPVATQSVSKSNTVQLGETRVTLMSLSSGVVLESEDDDNAGFRRRPYVQAVFLVEGKGGTAGEMMINGERIKRTGNVTGSSHKVTQVDHARAHWPGNRMEKVPQHAKDTDAIFEETYFGAAPLPARFRLSIEIGGKTFEFFDLLP